MSLFRLAMAGLGTTLLGLRTAAACGGFFCAQTPVLQSGERIIFGVDVAGQTVDAVIQISYQGSAESFAWLLPLQSEPSQIRVGSTQAFLVSERLTAPQFRLNYDLDENCQGIFTNGPPRGGVVDAGAAQDAGTGVTVLSRQDVGPYASVVLRGSNPDEVRQWLVDNEYVVTDEMMESVVPYIAKGDVLLALRLLKNNSVGDLQPIDLTMTSTEPCIPLRLTAIAAETDMDVTALVLSNQGRAIPSNYLHVDPNLAKLNWISGGADYRQLLGEAADEAGGNAFTTEFAGSTEIFRDQIFVQGRIRLDAIQGRTTLGGLLDEISAQGLWSRSEILGIVTRSVTDEALLAAGVDPTAFRSCPACYSFQLQQVPVDGQKVGEEVDERILQPDMRSQSMFQRFSKLTRLYTLISPDEMTIDPIFDFDSTLPDVDNVRQATLHVTCDATGVPTRQELELATGQTFVLGSDGRPTNASTLPSALRIEQLKERRVIKDNTPVIVPPPVIQTRDPEDCDCHSTATSGETPWALLGLLGFLARRRKR